MEGELPEWINEQQVSDFKGTAEDLLHLGNIDAAILKDSELGRKSYNDKLLKYNSKYAQLIGKQKSNVDEIAKIVSTLPNLELIDRIRKDIHELDKKQRSFKDHFDDFQRLTQQVTSDYLAMRQSRGGDIVDAKFE